MKEPFIREKVEARFLKVDQIGSLGRSFKIYYLYHFKNYPAAVLAEQFKISRNYVFKIVRTGKSRFGDRAVPNQWHEIEPWRNE